MEENKLFDSIKRETNFVKTENGALAHKTTFSKVYDMFALGGAYRKRSDADCILLFKNALAENEILALKCLFYLLDVRGGQGERRFFRVCYKWLCETYPEIAKRNLDVISEYGRYDDILYATDGTKLEDYALFLLKEQLELDLDSTTPSLLAKWLPSENASNRTTNRLGNKVRTYLKMTHKQYRQTLAKLRARINIVERLMSKNRWDEIEFDKIPSKAGLIYKNAFARRDLIAKKYEAFIKDETKTVNTRALFPYEIVAKATEHLDWYGRSKTPLDDTDRKAIEKYWNNLPDYLQGTPCKMLCMCDTSGSMTGSEASAPINSAIALSMYCAERIGGPWKNHYISFASKPQLIEIEGADFVDKVERIYKTNLVDNTNLIAAFDLLLSIARRYNLSQQDMPETLVVLSDMEIDSGTGSWYNDEAEWTAATANTEMEKLRVQWELAGYKLPKLVYWNLESRNENKFLDSGENVTFVSGNSPVLFEQVIKGVTGMDLMLEKLNSKRYEAIQ